MKKLRISPAARMASSSTGVLLTSDFGTFQLHGADVGVFASVLEPLLDGSRDADAIAAALPGYSVSSVISFLELLRQRGLVEEMAEGDVLAERRKPQDRFFHSFTLDAELVASRLANARVLLLGAEAWGAVAAVELAASGVGSIHIVDDGLVLAEDLLAFRAFGATDIGKTRRDALQAAILRLGTSCQVSTAPVLLANGKRASGELEIGGGPFSLALVAFDGENLHLLQKAARFAHQADLPSLYGQVDGFESWLGPLVIPGKSACWNCLRLRRLALAGAAQSAHELDAARLAAPPAPRSRVTLAPMAAQNGLALAMEALKLLTAYTPTQLLGRFRVQNLVTQESTEHTVMPLAFCELCGGAEALVAAHPEAVMAPVALDQLGDVEALRRLLAGWVDAKAGVIHTLSGTSGDTASPPPLTASAYLASYTEGQFTTAHAGQIGSGKGMTALSAHIGAVGEAVERYSAARYRLQKLKVATYQELKKDAIDPRRLCLYDEAQYAEPGFPFARFSTKRPLHWVEAKWLGSGKKVWLPALLAYFNFQPPPAEYFCQVSSNGLAAGATLDDAAVRATFELIERDAAMLTWLCRLEAPRITVDESLDAGSAQVLHQLEARGVACELYLLDVGTGVPTVFCLGLGDGQAWPAVTVSLATHTDPRRAAAKAILEQAHVGPYLASLLPTAKIPATFAEVLTLEDHAAYYMPKSRLGAFDFLRRGSLPAVRLGEVPDAGPAEAQNCAARLEAAGLQVAIVDVTSPDVLLSPFRVARAVGKDMQPIHFGSRLRRLGNPRLKKLLGNKTLNPHPHPIA